MNTYSDHLPQLFDLNAYGLPLRAVTYNIAATGQPLDGYAYSDDCEILKAHEPDGEYQERLNRVLTGIKTMVENHNVDLVALQEAPFIKEDHDEESKNNFASSKNIRKSDIEAATGLTACYVDNNMWLLYKPNKIKYLLGDQSKDKNIPRDIPVQQLNIIVKGNSLSKEINCKLNLVHVPHQDEPFEHENLIRYLHQNHQENVITMGDFNCGIDPSQLSGLVPATLIHSESGRIEEKAYDFTDGCVFSGQNQSLGFVKGKCLNPKTGKEYAFKYKGKFKNQPDQRRYRALITLDDTEGRKNKLLEEKFKGSKVFSAYDIQDGRIVKGFAFPKNSKIPQALQLMEEGKMVSSGRILWPTPYNCWSPMENYKVYFVKPDLLIALNYSVNRGSIGSNNLVHEQQSEINHNFETNETNKKIQSVNPYNTKNVYDEGVIDLKIDVGEKTDITLTSDVLDSNNEGVLPTVGEKLNDCVRELYEDEEKQIELPDDYNWELAENITPGGGSTPGSQDICKDKILSVDQVNKEDVINLKIDVGEKTDITTLTIDVLGSNNEGVLPTVREKLNDCARELYEGEEKQIELSDDYNWELAENITPGGGSVNKKEKSYITVIVAGIIVSLTIGVVSGFEMQNWKTGLAAFGGSLFLLSAITSAYFYKQYTQSIPLSPNLFHNENSSNSGGKEPISTQDVNNPMLLGSEMKTPSNK